MSGEPYIFHPITVAKILAEMRMDYQSIVAAILHDVIEDTAMARDHIAEHFGEEVAVLVDGVSKLTHIEFETKAEAQAENFRKMLLAMVQDIRVILVKLADRLHNMRTLDVMRPDKRRRIAKETLEIYAPIANRLGMHNIRLELEDLGFRAGNPMRYRVLEDAMKRVRGNRNEIVGKIEDAIQARLQQEELSGSVVGREKHLYSIYRKMRAKRLPFGEVMDVFAFRIIVDKVDTCYRVLGAVHGLFTPVPGRFKDYIAIPKVNGYQSLHTVLFSPYSVPIEVQIRTEDMEKVADAGIAAHWLYKSKKSTSGTSAHTRARQWLGGLLEIQQNAGNSIEFLESVKIDLFPDEVYVFTPTGEIREMPRGATAVDFAYAVHTDVGNHCVAVKIDRRLMPLRTELLNGQTVEIITAKGTRPNPAWLDFVVTAKARTTIRHFLKNLKRDESIALGQRLLEKSLAAYNTTPKDIKRKRFKTLLKDYGLKKVPDLLEEIGMGNRIPALVARSLMQNEEGGLVPMIEHDINHPLMIKGTEGTVVTLAKCCRPIPGDPILGFVTAGRGIVVHTQTCNNVAEFRKLPEKWIDVQWDEQAEGDFPVDLRVLVNNKRGVLATVAAAIAELDANIENVNMEARDGLHSSLSFTVAVHGRQHLARILRRIRDIDLVERITRLNK